MGGGFHRGEKGTVANHKSMRLSRRESMNFRRTLARGIVMGEDKLKFGRKLVGLVTWQKRDRARLIE